MNYKQLADQELETTLKTKVEEESKVTLDILHLLAEVERRRLYSKQKYPSLFEYCVKVLKYCNNSAQKRIDAMRVLKLIPEVESKLETGELNLTTIGLAQTFFRAEVKAGKVLTVQDKKDVFKKIENKSAVDTIKEFIKISPNSMTQDKRRDLTETHTELKVTLTSEMVGRLDQLKSLLSNKHPHLKDSELFEIMVEICLEKLDPIKKIKNKSEVSAAIKANRFTSLGEVELTHAGQKEDAHVSNLSGQEKFFKMSKPITSPREVTAHKNPRYIPSAFKQEVWFKSKGCCTYLDPRTKEKCGSRHFLQIDHIKPIALGGKTELNNLRLVCQAHNLRYAMNVFGTIKMSHYLNK